MHSTTETAENARETFDFLFLPEEQAGVDALAALGVEAVCPSANGEAAWIERTKGRQIVVLPEDDDQGPAWTVMICRVLRGTSGSLRILRLPGGPVAWVQEHRGAGRGDAEIAAELVRLGGAASLWQGPPDDPPSRDDIPPFPTEVLPTPLRRYVEEAANAIGVPADFIAVPLLAGLGVAIGLSREIELKKGWSEGPRIYAAIVSEPGTKKSAAMDAAIKPLSSRQMLMWAAFQKAKEKYEQDLATYEVEQERWQKAVKQGKADPNDRPERPKEPVLEQLLTTNVTIEALCNVMKNSPRGILLAKDELAAWVTSMNQYKKTKGSDRQEWLSFWSGSPIVINRKSLPEPIVLSAPFVAVCGSIQPDILSELSDERGRQDGLIHRILFAYPDYQPTGWTDAVISEEVAHGLEQVFSGLFALPTAENPDGSITPVKVPLSEDGRAAFVEWYNALIEEMKPRSFPWQLRGPWAKMAGYCARLALLIHLSRFVCGETEKEAVDEQSVLAAAALIEYFQGHARRVYSRLASDEDDLRYERIYEWIVARGGRASVRDMVTHRVAGIKSASEAKDCFEAMADRGFGSTEEIIPPRGGPKTIFFVAR